MTVAKSSNLTLFACRQERTRKDAGPGIVSAARIFTALPDAASTFSKNTTSPETLVFTLSRNPPDMVMVLIWQ